MGAIIKSIVITGASSGIGYATCEHFLKQDYLVFGSVRKSSDASRLQNYFDRNFVPLVFDVKDKKKVLESAEIVKKYLGKNNLTALVNNAGIAVLGPLEFINLDEFQEQLQTNLVGALNCTQAFLPLLGSKASNPTLNKGRIINVSSALGGKIGYPFYGAYCSSKHALEGFSEALRRELKVHKIHVSVIAPGAIRTPIWNKAETKSLECRFEGTVYQSAYQKVILDMKKLGKNGLKPEIVASKIFQAVEARNPRYRYTFISEFMLNLLYFTPRLIMDILLTHYLGLTNNKSSKFDP